MFTCIMDLGPDDTRICKFDQMALANGSFREWISSFMGETAGAFLYRQMHNMFVFPYLLGFIPEGTTCFINSRCTLVLPSKD